MARSNLCKPSYLIKLERVTREISHLDKQQAIAQKIGKSQQAVSKNISENSFSLTDFIRIWDAYPDQRDRLISVLGERT